jgi:hypothetical protein
MSMFRAKRLDLGCFVNVKVIRDHTKRKVFAEHEPERYASHHISYPLDRVTGSIVLRRKPLESWKRFAD